jgi:hypothetical protein
MAGRRSGKGRGGNSVKGGTKIPRPNLPQHHLPAPYARLQDLGPDDFTDVYDEVAGILAQGDARAAAQRLIGMVQDESYYDYDEGDYEGGRTGDPRAWTRLHALRVLGRLGDAAHAGIEPLLPLLKAEDDFLREDVPFYYAAMGRVAVEPLSRALADGAADTYYRVGAGESLAEIGEKYPELRDAIVPVLERTLAEEKEDSALTGFLIINLCDLAAREALPTIELAYKEDRVDDTLVSLAEVQEHLGVPITAAPPRWDYGPGEPRRVDPLSETVPEDDADDTVQKPFVAPEKVGRNDPCPCGSGRKYKKCCGAAG